MKCFRLLSILFLAGYRMLAQQEVPVANSIFSVGGQLHYGSIFAHSKSVENTAGSRPIGIALDAVWQKISQKVWDNCNCYPKMGATLAYYDYDNQVLGHGVHLGYFLEPTFRLARSWDLATRGAFGLSYLTNPYHPVRNPFNMSYSMQMSAYLAIGIGNQFRISDRWSTGVYFNYQHTSNGGLKEPNKGINWITGSVGVYYHPQGMELPVRNKQPFTGHKPPAFEINGFTANTTARVGDKQRHFIFGLSGLVSKQIGRLDGITIGAELFHDAVVLQRMEYDNSEGGPWRSGLLAGHQFLLGKFIFSQQVGVYLYQQNSYFDAWYHRWSLQYYPGTHIGMGFSLLAHRHVANFIDLRLSYRISRGN